MSDIKELVRIDGQLAGQATISAVVAGEETISAVIYIPETTGGEAYQGDYTVTPKAHSATVLETQGKLMTDDVTVIQIPYFETSNTYGKTAYIANEV